MGGSMLQADVGKGKRFYLKHLKAKFGMEGAAFTALHTAAEWETLFEGEAEGFVSEFSGRFPAARSVLNAKRFRRYRGDLKDFAVHYAQDSGRTPTCGDTEAEAETPALLTPSGMSEQPLF